MKDAYDKIAQTELPIDGLLPELLQALEDRTSAVLVAAPGAGKTTRVPLALLAAPWLSGQRISCWSRVGWPPVRLRGHGGIARGAVGGTVGYRVRMDTKVGPRTRIEVITEGVLTRMLQQDPSLDGVGLVIFDEFHERHLHGDLGLALCLQAQAVFREELRLLVMSATLEAEPVAGCWAARRCWSAKDGLSRSRRIFSEAAGRPHGGCRRSLHAGGDAAHEGDALVFLPGAGEIRRVERLLRGANGGGTAGAPD